MRMALWFRFYTEALEDPKVQILPPEAFRYWVNCLCLASRNEGYLPPLHAVSFAFHQSDEYTQNLLNLLSEKGLLDNKKGRLTPHNWFKRQYKSDSSTPRVKQFRERKRNVSETLQKRPQSQIQSQNTETEKKEPLAISSLAMPNHWDSFQRFWVVSTRRGSKKDAFREWRGLKPDDSLQTEIAYGMASWQKSEQWQDETKQPHICRWLKRRGWEEVVPRASHNGNGRKPFKMPSHEELEETEARMRAEGAI